MSVKISELAEQLNMTQKLLKEKIIELGFDIKKTARTLDDELAELVMEEFTAPAEEPIDDSDTVSQYESMIEKELDREIIKSQRKKKAGKDKHSDKGDSGDDAVALKGKIEIPDVITVKEFAEKTGLNVAKLIGELMKNGILANINQQIDFDTAQVVAEDLGVKIKKIRTSASAEDIMERNLDALLAEEDKADLSVRPPIISVMGHVDHGKTSLLDSIREADVISTESGGITQHIGAYQVEKNGRKITFLDTPGHEAFTAMRARGAKATDIAILVVAADEGVKPQTIEAINHAKDAGIPILVAINKIDKEGANPDRVMGELAEHGLQSEAWGGKTIMVPVSALTGEGIPSLLEMVLLVADMEELNANANREAVGTVVEAHLDKSLGPVATILVNTGTLKIMDNVVVGGSSGRIKAMYDHHGKRVKKAGPSTPVLIAGLSEAPFSGDILQVMENEKTARSRAIQIKALQDMAAKGHGIDKIMARIQSGDLKALKLIVKADTKGSLEAIRQSLAKIPSDDITAKIVHSGVGDVTETDVNMAAAGEALICGFHVHTNGQVDKLSERFGVDIRRYTVIYKLIEDVKKIMTGLLDPEEIEVILGRAEIKEIFFTKKSEKIVGCKVESGKVENKTFVRVFRGEEMIGEGRIDSLKKVKEVVKELKAGNDCGIKFVGKVDLEPGDRLESYRIESRERTIE